MSRPKGEDSPEFTLIEIKELTWQPEGNRIPWSDKIMNLQAIVGVRRNKGINIYAQTGWH